MGQRRIVVTGLGVIASNASNKEEFCHSLQTGTSGIKEVTLFDVNPYCNAHAGAIDGKHIAPEYPADSYDRATRLALTASREALGDAGLPLTQPLGPRARVALGNSLGGWFSYCEHMRSEHRAGVAAAAAEPFDGLVNVPPCRIASAICEEFGISGGHVTAVTACAAGSNSIALGLDMIRENRADVVLSCATDPLCELSFSGFNILMVMTSGVSRPFDRNRTGLLVGEGAGCLVLEELEHARKRNARIYCEIPGYGLSNDAHHPTQPDPTASGACRAISRALTDAGIDPSEMDYINAHGTSTVYNDLTELRAVRQMYGERSSQIPISSIKSMIGHTLGAAGVIEAIATVLALEKQFLPPTVNFETPMDDFNFDFVPQSRPITDARVMSSHSFGFGGNAACIIFRKLQNEPETAILPIFHAGLTSPEGIPHHV